MYPRRLAAATPNLQMCPTLHQEETSQAAVRIQHQRYQHSVSLIPIPLHMHTYIYAFGYNLGALRDFLARSADLVTELDDLILQYYIILLVINSNVPVKAIK